MPSVLRLSLEGYRLPKKWSRIFIEAVGHETDLFSVAKRQAGCAKCTAAKRCDSKVKSYRWQYSCLCTLGAAPEGCLRRMPVAFPELPRLAAAEVLVSVRLAWSSRCQTGAFHKGDLRLRTGKCCKDGLMKPKGPVVSASAYWRSCSQESLW